MGVGGEGAHGVVEAITLPIRSGRSPSTRVADEPKRKFMVAPVLVGLVRVRAAEGLHSGGTKQRQADGVVCRLIGAVFAIGENGDSVVPGFVRQVDPAVREHLELPLLRIGPLDRAEILVVGSVGIRGAQGKRYL